jgi:expansin (peptidoglycan-binding protein)
MTPRGGERSEANPQGKNIVITNPATGQTATAEVVDLCPGCAQGALDMSTGLFSYLNNGNMDAGVFQMEWNYAS